MPRTLQDILDHGEELARRFEMSGGYIKKAAVRAAVAAAEARRPITHDDVLRARPELVVKGGFIAWSQMGDPGASIPTPQPSFMRPMFGARRGGVAGTSLTFVSKRAWAEGHLERLGLRKQVVAVRGCRGLQKRDMKLNDLLPRKSCAHA